MTAQPYFVAFALAGALLGAELLLGEGALPAGSRRAALASYAFVLLAPFALGFGLAGVLSQGLGATRWPGSLYHACGAGGVLAGLSLLGGLLRERWLERGAAGGPGVEAAVEQRDEPRAD
jgi:hypothetical protein